MAETGEGAPTQPEGVAREIGKGIGEAIIGPRLSADVKYQKFLKSARYFNKKFEPIRPEAAPDFYVNMTDEERDDHELTIEFLNAANFKKMPPGGLPPNLDTLGKNPGFQEIATPETQRLCEIPGVEKCLQVYVEVFDTDRELATRERTLENGDVVSEGYTLRTAKNRKEVDECRKKIAVELRDQVTEALWQSLEKPLPLVPMQLLRLVYLLVLLVSELCFLR